MTMKLSTIQRRVLAWLAAGAIAKHDSNRDGRLERVIFKDVAGVVIGRCAYETWQSLTWRGLTRWSHPNDPDFRLRITDAGRAALAEATRVSP